MKKYYLLGIVLALFLITRLFKITQIPGSVYWDEASIGYNAYAVATDLKDEWGETLPLHFRAFGEFKLPVYIYSVAILTRIFGLSDMVVRLPAVLYGLGVVVLTYLLVVRITKDEKTGLIASFILTVSPWLFIFSRTGYEAVAGLFFFLLFIYFLELYKRKKLFIIFAALAAVLAIYSYNSFRILIPLFIVFWALTQRHKNVKLELIALGIFLMSLIPIARLVYLDAGAARLATVGLSNPAAIVKSYFSHFDFGFLFLEGDANVRHQVPDWGQLYLIELPLFLAGVWRILKSKNKLVWLFLVFLVLAPIPASIAKESPHALRAILMAFAFASISALGLVSMRRFVLPIAVVIYLFYFGLYFRDFVGNYNLKTSSDWQYEYKEIFVNTREGIVTDKYAQPYIFALYYLKYPPQEFRNTVKYNPMDKWGFSTVASFGNFQFK